MSFWDEIRDRAAKAAGQVGQKLSEVRDRTSTELTVLRIKRQISAAEEQIDTLYHQLGRRAYELADQGKLSDAECRGIAEEVRHKRELIAGYEDEIATARQEAAAEAAGKSPDATATPGAAPAGAEPSPKEGAPAGGPTPRASWDDDGTPPRGAP